MKNRAYFFVTLLAASSAWAEPPSTAYIFPAGGRRGETVQLRIGGHYLHEKASLETIGGGVAISPEITRMDRIWFEGPLIKQPASQQKEDYPQDYAGQAAIAADAPLDRVWWRVSNAQGTSAALPFVVGDLPEVVEQENDGQPIPVSVQLPLTANGRIFPREDVDVWSFEAQAGQSVTCSLAAKDLGSPLEASLEIRDPAGRIVAESGGGLRVDPQIRFTAKEAGVHQVYVGDTRAAGGQAFVYRLTMTSGAWLDRIYPLGGKRGSDATFAVEGQALPEGRLTTRLPDMAPGTVRRSFSLNGRNLNGVLCDVDDITEIMESAEPLSLSVPSVANGRIETPGDADGWSFTGVKGTPLRLEIRAARLGSPLDGVLTVKNSEGKELAKAEDFGDGSPDCELTFTPPADGTYTAEVSERFASRGGAAFAYRLRIAQAASDFQLTVPAESLAVDVGGEKKIAVNVIRTGGFKEPVKLNVEGLPSGATTAEVVVAPNQNKVDVVVKLEKSVPVQTARLRIVGRAGDIERTATFSTPVSDFTPDHLLLATTLPTPFKFQGEFQLRYIARGGLLKKHYRIERNGFEGPLEVRLADRQGRHLQGVTGPTITVPPSESEFDYAVALAPGMELGRTSRTNLMLTGELPDASGKLHKVCFSTNEQNEQLIAIVSPGPLRLTLDRTVLPIRSNGELATTVRIQRDRSLTEPCRLDLIVPPHMTGITADAVTAAVKDDSVKDDSVVVRLKTGDKPGPFNQPLILRGTTMKDGSPIVAEVAFELVMEK